MKTLSILLLIVLLFGLAVEVASAYGAYTVDLASGKVCYIHWDRGGATGTWRLRWNYYNGQANMTYYCSARLSYGVPPSRTLRFAATNQPWCNIQNQAVVNTSGGASWTCQAKYRG